MPGARIGKYEIVHRIAYGGMAEIYLARASGIHGFEKYVVLKRILPQYAANEDFVRMFLKEARVAASLDHANVAHVYDIGEVGRDTFFTMEYLHGEDLLHIMRALRHRGERLPLEHALEIAIAAAAGLHFAHDKRGADGRTLGIVHRDVSPSNIVVTYDGGVKVVDFGIAKLGADPELSQRYSLKGKLAYMSPEQLHNGAVDRRSDVFALGIVLYETTAHVRLFKGCNDVQTMKAVLGGVVPPPSSRAPDYPPALERIVMRALAHAPEDRYQSARDLQVDLEGFAHDQRLRLSQSGLAEWMEATFGPKEELWHTLNRDAPAVVSPVPSRGLAVVADTSLPTKVVSRADVQPAPVAAPEASAASIQPSVTESRPPRRSMRAVIFTIAAAILVAAGASAMWGLRARSGDRPRSGGAASVVLVAEQGQVAVEPVAREPAAAAPGELGTPASTPVAAPLPTPSPVAPLRRRDRRPGSKSRHAGAAGGAESGTDYSVTFARREGEIRRCFLKHPGDRASVTEISLRFDVQADGHVTSVGVLPPALGDTSLGACLAAIGKSTVFARQAAPVRFRIPVTVQIDKTAEGRPPVRP